MAKIIGRTFGVFGDEDGSLTEAIRRAQAERGDADRVNVVDGETFLKDSQSQAPIPWKGCLSPLPKGMCDAQGASKLEAFLQERYPYKH